MSRHFRASRAALPLILSIATLVASQAPAAQPMHPRTADVEAAIERATAGLDLSAAQRADVDRIAARYADSDEPGVLWRVADELRTVLTPAQVETLRERPRAERRRRGEAREGRMRERRAAPDARRRREHREHGADAHRGDLRMRHMAPGIAEEHREAARALAESHREQMQALREQREDGAIEAEEFAERARALREEMRAGMEPLMTDEARRMHAEMMEMHERMRAVRDDVLRLTEEQRAAMQEHMQMRMRRGAGERGAMSTLSAEQRATMTIFHALMRGAHAPGDGRPRQMER